MRMFFSLAACLMAAACAIPGEITSLKNTPGGPHDGFCAGQSDPSCRFVNSPVRLEQAPVRLPRRALLFYPTAEPLEFVDRDRREWVAPRRTLTDGASIPKMFISIIGNPTSREFANAAAVHDAYCGVGNEAGPNYHIAAWRQVHRMFYDALRVGGTPEIKAKVMFAAVYLGGPRWQEARYSSRGPARDSYGIRVSTAGAVVTPGADRQGPLAHVPEPDMRNTLRRTIRFIQTNNPGIPEIEAFVDNETSRMVSRLASAGESPDVGEDSDPAEDPAQDNAETDPTTGETDPVTGDPTDPTDPTGLGTDVSVGTAGGEPGDPASVAL